MMRTKRLFFLAMAGAVWLVTPASARMAFEDNKLNFRSCEGQNLTARWRDNNFHLSVPGKTLNPSSPNLNYVDWDGKCRSVHLDGQGRFANSGEGVPAASPVINYLSWDGTKWSAVPSGGGFYAVLVGDKDQTVSAAQVQEAARWLTVNKAESRAAERLAKELTAALGQ